MRRLNLDRVVKKLAATPTLWHMGAADLAISQDLQPSDKKKVKRAVRKNRKETLPARGTPKPG
jgi:hypothetical protein